MYSFSHEHRVRGLFPITLFAAVLAMTANATAQVAGIAAPPAGSVERLDPQLDDLVDANAKVEFLGEGYIWSEGPVWVPAGGFLLFSDVPTNTVFKYKDGEGVTPFLKPSGYTGTQRKGGRTARGGVDELGSNGLTLDDQGRLILCQHGDRCVARLDSPLTGADTPVARFTVVANRWQGKRFDSPNDVVRHSSGALYFTDPPYGLEKGGDVSTREIDFSGVYRIAPDGAVTLVTREMTKPNGLAFSPDEKILYVGQSDGSAPLWRAFPVNSDGSLSAPKVFFDATSQARAGKAGSPDGFKVDAKGNLFATGPGGVLVISPEGKHLGTISTGDLTSNCAFGDDGSALYITSNTRLCRIKLKTKGAGF
jgi:gluconolactonase